MFRDYANDIRLQFQGDADHLRRVRHFQVQAGLDNLPQTPDVAILNMPAIFPQMRGNALRPGGLANQSGCHGIRLTMAHAAIPRFTYGGDVINVNTQFEHDN